MKAARTISGFAVFAAIFFSSLFALTFFNRLRIYDNRDQYRPATFRVDGAVYQPAQGDDCESYWLTGTVGDRAERFIPDLPPKTSPQSADDLLALYPRGSRIAVLYNPRETETIVQNETLRVLHFTPDFWRKEERLRNKLFAYVLLPVPFTVGLYLTIRYLHVRSQRNRPTSSRFGMTATDLRAAIRLK